MGLNRERLYESDYCKNSGPFRKEEQAIAFDKAKAIITSELTEELKIFITQNYGDLQKWITNQVEASIYKLKNCISPKTSDGE